MILQPLTGSPRTPQTTDFNLPEELGRLWKKFNWMKKWNIGQIKKIRNWPSGGLLSIASQALILQLKQYKTGRNNLK